MNRLNPIILCIFLGLFVNCSDSDKSPASPGGRGPGGTGGGGTTKILTDAEISAIADEASDQDYHLLVDLDFGQSFIEKQTRLKDSQWEHVVQILYFSFQKQVEVDSLNMKSGEPYCRVLVETNESVKPRDVFVRGGVDLKYVSTGTGQSVKSNNGVTQQDYHIRIGLQVDSFRILFMECHNTDSVAAMRSHIGNILEITEPLP